LQHLTSNVLSPIKQPDLKEWKNAWKDSTYTLNRDIVWGKRQNMRSSWQISKSNGSRRICAIFLIGVQFMILIATMKALKIFELSGGSSIDIGLLH
jgi:hypothetical protein